MKRILLYTLIFLLIPIVTYGSQIFAVPKLQIADDSGDPAASWTLNFYYAGTSTPLTVYSDSSLSTSLGSSVTLDSRGEYGAIFLGASAKVILKDADATAKWTVDNWTGGTIHPLDHVVLSSYTNLATAISTLGATVTTMYIDANDTMNGDVTIPATMAIKGVKGNTITVGTHTLTINGPVWADTYQIFNVNSTGTVAIAGDVKVEWFGVSASATAANNTAYLKDAIDAVGGLLTLNCDFECEPTATGPLSYHGNSVRDSKTCAVMKDGLQVDGRQHTVTLSDPGTEGYLNYFLAGSESSNYDNIVLKNIEIDEDGGFTNASSAFGFYEQDNIVIENCNKTADVSQLIVAQNSDYGRVSNVYLGATAAKLGWWVFCDHWTIDNIVGGQINSEMIDLDSNNTHFTITNITQEGYTGTPDVIDINASSDISISNFTFNDVYIGILFNTKLTYATWAGYESGGATTYQSGTGLTISNGTINTSASKAIKIGTTNVHDAVSCVSDVTISNVVLKATLNGIYVDECKDLVVSNVIVDTPGAIGIYCDTQIDGGYDANESDLTGSFSNIRILDAVQEGFRIDYCSDVTIDGLYVNNANTGDGDDGHVKLLDMEYTQGAATTVSSTVFLDNIHIVAGSGGTAYAGLWIGGNDDSNKIMIDDLEVAGSFSNSSIKIPEHDGIFGKTASFQLGDAAASTDMEVAVLVCTRPTYILGGENCLTGAIAKSADDTNFVYLRMTVRAADGTDDGVLAGYSTQATDGAAIVAYTSFNFDDESVGNEVEDVSIRVMAAGETLTAEKTDAGTGETVSDWGLTVNYLEY